MIKYALQLILRRKLRTFLTSLGITIAIVLLGFIIFGMKDLQNLFVNEFNSVFQPNQLIVSRFGLNSVTSLVGNDNQKKDDKKEKQKILDDRVVSQLRKNASVEKIDPLVLVSGMQMQLKGYDDIYSQPFISGWDTDKSNPAFTNVISNKDKPGKGEIFVSTNFVDGYNLTPENIIGKKVIIESSSSSLFSTRSKSTFGKKFTYTITGVFDPGQDKNDGWLSTNEALKILVDVGGFKDNKDYLRTLGYDELIINVRYADIDSFKAYFKETYGYKPLSSDEILSFLGNITQGLTIALVMFGLVSAVVASIGIINTMVMSIYEQTKEIGIIKAIGASNTQVLIIFLIQSGMIGLIGGALGLGIVYFGMLVLDPIVVSQLKTAGFSAQHFFTFDPTIGLIIVSASIIVGILAGLYPAIRASRLDPVKALRYE